MNKMNDIYDEIILSFAMPQRSTLTFVDIDDTLFNTTAQVRVIDKEGNLLKTLSNSEFNHYKLNPGESYDFAEFKSSKIFHDQSKPIQKNIERVKKIINKIQSGSQLGKVIILTARSSFDDKNLFLQTFRNCGIDIDNKDIIYVERTGDIETDESIPEKKNKTILKYLSTGQYNIVKLIDDHIGNINGFRNFANSFAEKYPEVIEIIRKNFPQNKEVPFNNTIIWWPLLTDPKTGTIKLINV